MTEIEFLKEKGAFDQFIHNLKMNGYKDMCAYQDKNHLLSNFFDCAFLWDSTPEGHDYWSDIKDEYITLYGE